MANSSVRVCAIPKSFNVASCSVRAFIGIPPDAAIAYNVDSLLQELPLIEDNHEKPVKGSMSGSVNR